MKRVSSLIVFLLFSFILIGENEVKEFVAKGCVAMNGKSEEELRIIAKAIAMAELSKELEVYVESIEKLNKNQEGTEYNTKIILTSKKIFENIVVLNEGINEEKEYFIVLKLKLKEPLK